MRARLAAASAGALLHLELSRAELKSLARGATFNFSVEVTHMLNGPSFPFFVLGLPHVTLIELRVALISYQDYHMLLLTLAGLRAAKTKAVRLAHFDVPTVSVVGGGLSTPQSHADVVVSAKGKLPACSGRGQLRFSWRVLSSVPRAYAFALGDRGVTGAASSRLFVPGGTLVSGGSTRLRVTASLGGTNLSSSADVELRVRSEPVRAEINGGSSRVVVRDGTLLLNASASADPDDPQGLGQKRLVFAWSCKGGAKGAPPAAAACAPLGKLPAANTLRVSASRLKARHVYTFSLLVSDGASRSARASVEVLVASGTPPEVAIDARRQPKFSPSARLVLKGPPSRKSARRSSQRALLMPLLNPGSLYHYGKRT